MEKELTPQQSLELIKETILQARSSFMRISPFFLIWGIVFVIAGLVEFYLKTQGHLLFWTSWRCWISVIPSGGDTSSALKYISTANEKKDF